MRAIIRLSIDQEKNSKLRNHVAALLRAAGFTKVGTGSWEHRSITMQQLKDVMAIFWHSAADPQRNAGADPGVTMDHVWIYTDTPEV